MNNHSSRIHPTILIQMSVKGQVIADFLVDHLSIEVPEVEKLEVNVFYLERAFWILKFYSSSIEDGARLGVFIISLVGIKTTSAFNMNFPCTNNHAEYEALIIGLEILKELRQGT